MAGDLPFLDNNILMLIIFLIMLISVGITILAFYRYFKYENTLSALVTAIGFLLVAIFGIVDFLDNIGFLTFGFHILYNNNLGGLDVYIFLIGIIVLLVGIVLRIIREE